MRLRKKNSKKSRIQLEYIDIREVLDNLGISYAESGKNVSNGWIGTTCPFCSDESTHLGINLKGKSISCFKCGTSGTIIKYLAEELNSFDKAIQILRNSVPRELRSDEEQKQSRVVRVELPKEASRKITPYHAGYLKNRNFDWKKLTDKYNLHFCGPLGEWKNRIIIPIIKNYRLVTFTSVDISDETNIRYKHLSKEKSIIHVKEYLFGIEHTNKHSVIVTEGFFDMLRIGDGAVCSFGTTVTNEQKKILSQYPVVKIIFDGDEAGRKAGNKLANDLASFTDVRLFEIPEGLDPDNLSKDDINKLKES